MGLRITKATLGKVLRVASDVIPKLPSSSDSPFTWAVKLLGIADSIGKVSGDKGGNALAEFFEGIDAKLAANEHFVQLFFGTRLGDVFQVDRIAMSDSVDVVRARHREIGTLWFVEYQYGSRPEPARDFRFSHGFRFDLMLDRLWAMYDERLHLEVVEEEYGRRRSSYCVLPRGWDEMFGDAKNRLAKVVAKHERYRDDGVPVTYLLVGPQGTGKSTFAVRMAEELGERILRIDAAGFTTSGLRELELILEGLKPGVIIVDDIDRAPDLASSLATLLTVLTNLKVRHPKVTAILTANDLSKFDAAMLRPGRVDELLVFDPPDAADRLKMIASFAEAVGVALAISDARQLATATEGLGAAYLEYFVGQLRYELLEEVLAMVAVRKKLAGTGDSATISKRGGTPVAPSSGAPHAPSTVFKDAV